MRLEDVTAQLRPRGASESVDLGFAMVRRHFPLLIASWFLTVVPLWAVLLVLTHWLSVGWMLLVLWWLKPIYDRVPLFVLSRALFGAPPRLREVLAAWPGMLGRYFFGIIFLRFPWLLVAPRFSWARSLLLPVIDLEQQRGRGFRERQRVLLDRAGNTAGGLIMACGLYEVLMVMGLLTLFASLGVDPLGSVDRGQRLFEMMAHPASAPPWLQWSLIASYLITVTFVEIFYVGGGFGLYLNCRTHLEGWDVEITFRRLARRLGSSGTAILMSAILLLGTTGAVRAADEEAYPTEKQVIERVMKDDDFIIHKRKVPKMRKTSSSSSKTGFRADPDFGNIGAAIFWLIVATAVGWVAWLIYKNWHLLVRSKAPRAVEPAGPRTILGMEITPDSLPRDLVAAARERWQAGDARGALSLLYRGSVAWLVGVAKLGIRESDTEEDCLRQAGTLPNAAATGYFSDLTDAWIHTAYAREVPAGPQMERLLQGWPFAGQLEGRAA